MVPVNARLNLVGAWRRRASYFLDELKTSAGSRQPRIGSYAVYRSNSRPT
jgi:hypothetical protein